MKRKDLKDHTLYPNRHVPWLAFNQRGLGEARDTGNPLLDGVRFLAITANNRDEFVEIRVRGFQTLSRVRNSGFR
jgi:polyphosphate kinase